jgi:mannitol/fructose-specific phosphotransferase system IIA component (Ntr-type)
MIRFSTILRTSGVLLDMDASSLDEGIRVLLKPFESDPRISDIKMFSEGILKSPAPAIEEDGVTICIPHSRTESARELVMSAGRPRVPILHPGIKSPIHLIFLAGIPSAFSSEYLRALGAIARICKNTDFLTELLTTPSPMRFVEILDEGLNKM